MAWVFICIAVGAAGFLVYIVLDYLKIAAGMKPKTDNAKAMIRDSENRINAEQKATKTIKLQVASLQREVEDNEKRLTDLQKQLTEHQEEEKRKRPTKYKVDDD